MALPLPPQCVSVSPDGLFTAIGHNALISYVNLSSGTLEKTLVTSADVFDVVLAANGYVHAFPRLDQWSEIHSVELATGNTKMYLHERSYMARTVTVTLPKIAVGGAGSRPTDGSCSTGPTGASDTCCSRWTLPRVCWPTTRCSSTRRPALL